LCQLMIHLICVCACLSFFFSSRRRHTRFSRDWSSDVCSSDLWGQDDELGLFAPVQQQGREHDAGRKRGLAILLADEHEELFDERSEERRVGKEWRSRWCA